MPYISRTIRSGDLLEKEVYFATRNGKKIARSVNIEGTPEQMARVNERNAQKKMQRLMCANFSHENGDMFVTFTFAEEITEEQALKEERNLLDRIKRLRAKKGLVPLKYIVVTEKQSQWHIHLIMNGGLSYEELQKLWGKRGRKMSVSTLDESDGYRGLVRYLCEEHKPKRGSEWDKEPESVKQPRRKYQRRWKASRNLIKPEMEKHTVKRLPPRGEPKAPKGYQLLADSWQYVESRFGIYTYAAFMRIERGGKRESGKVRRGKCGSKSKRSAGQRQSADG